jgi:hypothetical protein
MVAASDFPTSIRIASGLKEGHEETRLQGRKPNFSG